VSKPYTDTELADQLDGDLTWRVKELSDLKSAIAKSDPTAKSVLLRSLVTMLYAHWEGHIKFCAAKYFEFMTLRKFRFSQLEGQFYVNNFLAKLDALHNSRVSVSERCQLVAEIMTSSKNRFSRINPTLVDTRANLNSEVLRDICLVCAVDFSHFESKATFIDILLLKRRNSIAHGEATLIQSGDEDDLVAEGVGLMRTFKDALQNKVYLKTYKA
jgi:hypothetical protein